MAFRQVKKVSTSKNTITVTCVRSGKTRKVEKFKNSNDGSTPAVAVTPVGESPLDSLFPVYSNLANASFEEGELSIASDK